MVRHRVRLSWEQKKTILEECQERNVTSGKRKILEVCAWAWATLRLTKQPSYRVVLNIIRDRDRILMKSQSTHNSMMKDLAVKSVRIENIMVEWVWRMFRKQICITDGIICEKARKTQSELNYLLPAEHRTNLRFSNGWLVRFKRRNNFKCYKSHGESGNVSESEIENELPILKTLLSAYNPCDRFNADEFGLFYRMAPVTTIGPHRMEGRKKKKERITFLSCANADGSERVTPLAIGPSRNPRCFNGQNPTELAFYYRHNKKAWMTRLLFFEWLKNFDYYVSLTPGRRVILLLDNCSAHGRPDLLPLLSHVHVLYLPKNTTSRLQPLDAGVIASVKQRYRRFLVRRAVDNIDSETEDDPYKTNLKQAIESIYNIWNGLAPSIVRSGWCNTGLLEK